MIEIDEYNNSHDLLGYPYGATLSFGIEHLPEEINDNRYDGAQIRLFLIEVEKLLLDSLKEYMVRVQHDNVNQNLHRRFLLYSKSVLRCDFPSREKRARITQQVANRVLRMTQIYFENSNNHYYWRINAFATYPYQPLKMEEVYEKVQLLLNIEKNLPDSNDNELDDSLIATGKI
jgi:hypothetical protein